jgi:hypothetical protein
MMGIASEVKKLTDEIASSREERLKEIGEIKKEAAALREEAQTLIKTFEDSRGEQSTSLRRDLSRERAETEDKIKKMLIDFRSSRKGDEMLSELAQGTAARRAEVKDKLQQARKIIEDFRSEREKAGAQLQKELAQASASREFEVNQLRQDLREVRAKLQHELQEAAAAWQGLSRTTKKEAKAKEKEAPAEAASEEKPIDYEAELLAAVNNHPDGITLAEVADDLGVVPVVLGRPAKNLLDGGKIRKEEKHYYPLTGE